MRWKCGFVGACAAVCLLAAAAAGGCGGDDSTSGGPDAAVETGPTPAPFGLDARPSNTTCLAPARPQAPSAVELKKVFPGLTLNTPMLLTQIPGDGSRWFAALRSGTAVSFDAQNPVDATKTTVLTIPKPLQTAGEGGFLGMAFHPKFAQNGKVYISFTTTSGTSAANMRSVIAEMTSTDGGKTFPAASYKELLSFDQPYTNHDGGDLNFGSDGYLYCSFGDGGSGGDPLGHGQNTNLFFSKILRLDVDNVPQGKTYGIPPGNPFASAGGEPATFAYGFRNPFRFSVDMATDQVVVGDVGQNLWEEIDLGVSAGGDYGWNVREGQHCYSPATNCPTAGLIDPIWNYDHSQGNAVIGGVVYRGKAIPSFVGTYVFGDNGSGKVWSLTVDAQGKPVVADVPNGGGGGWVDFAQDQDGEVFAVSLYGAVYQLVASGPTPPDTFPATLSKTGCVDPGDPTKAAPGLIPYEPSSRLWSDGAEKHRWMALPDGKTITLLPDGDFDFPIGTVLVKEFDVGGKRVETRLFVRHDDGGWGGYSYEWNDAQTDATLLPSSKSKDVGGQTWYFPSRAECFRCHTQAANTSLGPEIGQLNHDFTYPETNRLSNQMATLDHIGMFSTPLPAPVDQLVAYPDPLGSGPLDARARAYLHVNCSMCHRPNAGGGGSMDFRFGTPLASAMACGVDPSAGDLGIAGAKIIAPGDPAKSLLVQRPSRLDAYRMPPLATSMVDTAGVGVLTQWVQSLSTCPAPPADAGAD